MRTLFLALFLCLSLTSCKYTEAPSAGLAKEMCSCLFISGQTESYCRQVTKESHILAKFEADFNRKEVWARGANFRAMARLDEDSRFGCSIHIVERDPEVNRHHNER